MKKRRLIISICSFIILLICFIFVFCYLSKLVSNCQKYEFDENGNLIFYYSGKETGDTKQYFKYNDNNQELESKSYYMTNLLGNSQVMTETFIYDEDGLLKKDVITWSNNDTITSTSEEEYFYNEKNQLIKQVSSSGNEYVYEYDDQGHKKTRISNNAEILKFEYNAIKNEDLQVEYSFDSTVVRWIYDDSGRILKEYYDNNSHEWFYNEKKSDKLSKEIIINEEETKVIVYKGNWVVTKCYENYQTEDEKVVKKSVQKSKSTYWPNKKIKTMKIYNIL